MNQDTRHHPPEARTGVRILQGGQAIPQGDSSSDRDITVYNETFAFTLAVGTRPPWGMPPGGILDAAILSRGAPGSDLLSLFDFLPDNWCSWPNTYQEVDILEPGPELGIISIRRDWGQVELETVYTLRAGSDNVHILTKMHNRSTRPLQNIAPGYTLYLKQGFMFTPPGLKGARTASMDQALTDWFAGYGREWALGLHAPFCSFIDHHGQDMLGEISIPAGETGSVEAWLQFCTAGDLSRMLQFETKRKDLSVCNLSGHVRDAQGRSVQEPVIVVEKEGHIYTWSLGSSGAYALELPPGEYRVHAAAENYAPSDAASLALAPGQGLSRDFERLQPPAEACISVQNSRSKEPQDARLRILEGYRPAVGFLGQAVYYTQLEPQGECELSIAPGRYVFGVEHGADFLSQRLQKELRLAPGEKSVVTLQIATEISPAEHGWFGADLHHHSDVLDGVTSPELVLRSQLASGLDLAFLSDHDSTANNREMERLASARNIPFLPAMEISAAWGHFNIFPLSPGSGPEIDHQSSTVQQIFAAAREAGAEVIEINHPYSTYGYFRSCEAGEAPGGYAPDFDLLELNWQYPVRETVDKAWELWNQGLKHYLAAGTDTHSVWEDTSGAARTYVKIEGRPTAESFVASLKAGRSFVTFGPLVFPELDFGSQLELRVRQAVALRFSLFAVNGLQQAVLINEGRETEELSFESGPKAQEIGFEVRPSKDTWYALVVQDRSGKRAYTNPIWISV